MKTRYVIALAVVSLVLGIAWTGLPALEEREGAADTVRLPKALREVSGLATLDNQHLLTVTDERAVVYEFDPESSEVRSFLTFGAPVRDDFEGIATIDGEIYLITSKGLIFGSSHERQLDTGLGKTCEIEGLDDEAGELVIACKENYDRADRDFLLLFTYSLASGHTTPRLRVPLASIPGVKELNPSAVYVDETGYYLLAARQNVLLILDPAGGFVAIRQLPEHPRAEGLLRFEDGRVAIAAEGKGKGGKITIYPSINDID